ncbi:MAG: manganese catalase family protein [Patulibacter minatonensis]
MFFHNKELAYTVRVDKPNPVFGRLLQQAIGGPEGEMRVMNQYLFQAWGTRGPAKYRDMLLHTGTEEIGHIEVLATAVAMNMEGAPEEMIDDVVTNPVVAARLGGLEPRHILSTGLAATPADANGVPFSAACLDIGGNLLANLHANVAAEAIGRTLAARLRALTDDPGMKDLLSYLIARDTMHQQQWLAAIDELNPEGRAVPVEVADEGDYAQYSHAFLTHADVTPPEDATWAHGTARDGQPFSILEPLAPAGQEPELQPVPPYVHAGSEATSNGGSTGLFGKVKAAVAP